MLKEAQTGVKKVSYETHRKKVFTSSFFMTLLAEQIGQVSEKYIEEGRFGKDIEVDIADARACNHLKTI
jgi:DNA repair photolyase